ncbi:SNF2 family N-terminal domain-containing protein [Cryptosporidium andersoni]|uniref:SNF2 family N-terminal domain-containing protein n=1 Tax=Cryptosporidium andersoni TaxID=117008 RepID=A0A1J4MWU7_9CRYT|nr:SNF2 family N-terminal domain-containing protein [Cryptosporidium andersoni]
MSRQTKGLRRYCDICRDTDIDVKCSQCGKVYHWDCLRNCNLIGSDVTLEDSFYCPDCKNNDEFCYICKDDDTGDTMLYCDGCPKSAHLRCLGLTEEPDVPMWYCPNCETDMGCKKKDKQNGDVRTLGGTKKTNDDTDINSDTCYVCQKTGKLLGCDFCTYSYHPKCIETEVFAFDSDKWKCPVCRGEDPLKNMRHKRMTKSERYKLSQEWQNCIKKQIKQSTINRDIFLWENRQAISPFVSRKVMERLKRNAENAKKLNTNSKSGRIRKIRIDEDVEAEDCRLNSENSEDAYRYYEAQQKAKEKSTQILSEGVELKDYQRFGVHWLLDAFLIKGGAILADEMGLGKTIQTLTFLSCLKALGITGPHLIVVPLSTVGNWAREVRRFTPNLTITKICGSRWEREHAMMDPVAADGLYDLYITTYETVVTEESFFVDNFRWQCIILDEAHRIKNEGGRIRHSMDRVSGSMRVLLTGTPLQNSLRELFTLLNFLFPDILQDSEIFEKIFQMKDITKSAVTSGSTIGSSCASSDDEIEDLDNLGIKVDSKRIKLFHRLLQKLLLRRTKDLVIKLPDKIIRDIWLPLSPFGWQWYKRLLDVGNIHGDVSFRKLLGLVIKMRICCSHPRGLVARSTQLDKLFSVFTEASPELLNEVTGDAYKLKSIFGWEHVKGSSKLFFLDKLLMQLHRENCYYISDYEESHNKYITEQIRSIKSRISELRCKGMEDSKSGDTKTTVGTLSFEKGYEEQRRTCSDFDENEESFSSEKVFVDLYSHYMYDKEINSDNKQIKTERNDEVIENTKENNYKSEKLENKNFTNINTSDKPKRRCRMHKVLIFTQFQLILDELENYCLWRGWQYMRLDGSTNKLIRELDIREFGLPDNYVFIYLICTRAGGLGINLVSANHVVMYDEDWNPFVDLQAVDRAHRIGQTRDVCIWKLVTEWSVEERMVFGREQKLKLDKMVIKAREEEREDELLGKQESKVKKDIHDSSFAPEEKLSAEEVTKLVRYGRKALMHMDDTSNIFEMNLEELMERKRVPIPDEDVLMQKEEKGELGEDKPEVLDTEEVDITEILCDEMDETGTVQGGNTGPNPTCSIGATTVSTSPADDILEINISGDVSTVAISPTTSGGDDDGILWRSKRTRKPPPPIYDPLHWESRSKVNEDKKLILKHERWCFRCGQSKADGVGNTKGNENSNKNTENGNKSTSINGCCGSPPNFGDVATNSGNTSSSSRNNKSFAQSDEYMRKFGLINCSRCPKSYHWSQCLGLDKVPPKTWICPWHECCLCFRRATQAGGLLIHCSECPTTFCIDCFPPEYARHQVLDSFFENLNKRGWNVSRDSMIVFLCSKCKALQQQEIRKKLSKQQLIEEQQRRRKMNEQLKSDVLKSGQKTLDQLGFGTSSGPSSSIQGNNHRLTPYIPGRKRNIEAIWKNTEAQIRKGFERFFPPLLYQLQQEYIQDNAKQEAAIIAGASREREGSITGSISSDKTSELTGSDKVSGETGPITNSSTEDFNIGSLRRSPWMRPPGEWLRLCDNCLLPFHDISGCSYPLEVVKVSVPSGVTQIDVETGQPIQLADGTKINSLEDLAALAKNPGFDSKFQTRSYCSLCGLSGRMHTRRSCPLLPTKAEAEYEERQVILERFIKTLNNYPVEFPHDLTEADEATGGWECYRKRAQKIAEEYLLDCFVACGLHEIIIPSGTAYIGRQNVARSVVYHNSANQQSVVNAMSSLKTQINNSSGSSAVRSLKSLSKQTTLTNSNIPTSSSMTAAAVAIQQRMNDAAISLARARYAAAAAAVTVAGFRHPQPIIPFPIVTNNPYSMFTVAGTPTSMLFSTANPAVAAATRANMIVGANVAAAVNALSRNRKRSSCDTTDSVLSSTNMSTLGETPPTKSMYISTSLVPWANVDPPTGSGTSSFAEDPNKVLIDASVTLDSWIKKIKPE